MIGIGDDKVKFEEYLAIISINTSAETVKQAKS